MTLTLRSRMMSRPIKRKKFHCFKFFFWTCLHFRYVIRCVVEYLIVKPIRRCVGRELCLIFDLEPQCDCPTYRLCPYMKHGIGYFGQRLFWNRARVAKYVLFKADFERFRREKQCHYKKCGHLKRHWNLLFCRQHACLNVCYNHDLPETQLYRTVLLLMRIFPKDIVRYHIAPYLRARMIAYRGEGHLGNHRLSINFVCY